MRIASLSPVRFSLLLCVIVFFAMPVAHPSSCLIEQAVAATDSERLGLTEAPAGEQAGQAAPAGEEKPASLAESLLGPFAGMADKGFSAVDLLLVMMVIYLCLRAYRVRRDRGSGRRMPPRDKGQESASDALNRWRKGTPYRASEYRDEEEGQDGEKGQGTPGANAWGVDDSDPRATVKRTAKSAWESLRSTPDTSSSARSQPGTPRDFDEGDFLEGAKMLYSRLQRAWAARNILELEPFLTPDMLSLLQEQTSPEDIPSTVEVLLVEATLLEVTREGEEERTRVLFSALLQEEGEVSESPVEVRELWHFTHNYRTGSNWQLDGIEAVADEE